MRTVIQIYRPGEEMMIDEVDFPGEPGFKALDAVVKRFIKCRNIEHVTVLFEDNRRDMFVDETGALDGLPRNEATSAIYRANWLKRHPKQDPESLPPIYGVAVLFPDRQVWF